MRMVYSDTLMDHFEHPRHAGALDGGGLDVGTGDAGTRETGGVLRVQIRVAEDGRVAEACFKAYGPPALIAAGSWLAETITGGTLEQAESLTHQPLAAALALPPARLHCALLAEDAMRAAIRNYKDKQRAYA